MNNDYKKLDEYFYTLMDRSPSRYKILEIAKKHFNGRTNLVGAEIGIFNGEFSKKINEYLEFDKFHLIDIWDLDYTYEDGTNLSKIKTNDYMKHIYENVLKKFSDDKYNIMKQPSNIAADNFADDSLDFIYIDGNHQQCGDDLKVWFKKLKQGGIIAGHDYYGKVKSDVDRFFNNKVRVVRSKIPQWIYINCSEFDTVPKERIKNTQHSRRYVFSTGNIAKINQLNKMI